MFQHVESLIGGSVACDWKSSLNQTIEHKTTEKQTILKYINTTITLQFCETYSVEVGFGVHLK